MPASSLCMRRSFFSTYRSSQSSPTRSGPIPSGATDCGSAFWEPAPPTGYSTAYSLALRFTGSLDADPRRSAKSMLRLPTANVTVNLAQGGFQPLSQGGPKTQKRHHTRRVGDAAARSATFLLLFQGSTICAYRQFEFHPNPGLITPGVFGFQ